MEDIGSVMSKSGFLIRNIVKKFRDRRTRWAFGNKTLQILLDYERQTFNPFLTLRDETFLGRPYKIILYDEFHIEVEVGSGLWIVDPIFERDTYALSSVEGNYTSWPYQEVSGMRIYTDAYRCPIEGLAYEDTLPITNQEHLNVIERPEPLTVYQVTEEMPVGPSLKIMTFRKERFIYRGRYSILWRRMH